MSVSLVKAGRSYERNKRMDYSEFLRTAEDFVFAEDQPEKADIIFVPGNGFPQMAERAAQLYKEGYAPYILPSGRYSITLGKFVGVQSHQEIYDGEYETEWEFLKSVLMKNGVPEEAILREDQATFTYENAIYSRQVTDRAGIQVNKAILCCKTYHAQTFSDVLSDPVPGRRRFWSARLPGGITQGKTGGKRKSGWKPSLEKLTGS